MFTVHLRFPLQGAFTNVKWDSNPSPPPLFYFKLISNRNFEGKVKMVYFYQSFCLETQSLTVLKSKSVFFRMHR